MGDFDQTLNRYGLTKKLRSNPDDDKVVPVSLAGLYEIYIYSRQDLVKPSTWAISYQRTLKRLQQSPFSDLTAELTSDQAYQVYDWAIANWAPDVAHKLMMQLNACFNWAIERRLVALDKSPFEGFPRKVRKAFKKTKPPINAFTAAERDTIIQAFQESERYGHFCNYVRFCFFTGCRPSEAIGLEWDDVAPDFSWIRFHQVVITSEGKQVRCEGLKTQESRIFTCNDQLKDILTDTRQQTGSKTKNIFIDKKGKNISVSYFTNYPWAVVLRSLPIPYRRPYCMRHTFITLCLEQGLDAKDVAQLVGNSPEVIYKHYAGTRSYLVVPKL